MSINHKTHFSCSKMSPFNLKFEAFTSKSWKLNFKYNKMAEAKKIHYDTFLNLFVLLKKLFLT